MVLLHRDPDEQELSADLSAKHLDFTDERSDGFGVVGVEHGRHDAMCVRMVDAKPVGHHLAGHNQNDRQVVFHDRIPQRREKIRSGQARREWLSQQATGPHDGHSVRQDHAGILCDVKVCGVDLIPDQVIDVRSDDTSPIVVSFADNQMIGDLSYRR